MACRKVGKRVAAVVKHQAAVEFRFDFHVGEPGFGGCLFHVRVAGGIQRKVAQEAVQIGTALRGMSQIGEEAQGREKKIPGGAAVHPVAETADRASSQRIMVKEKIRPMQADIEQLPAGGYGALLCGIQTGDDFLTETIVSIGSWHGKLLIRRIRTGRGAEGAAGTVR